MQMHDLNRPLAEHGDPDKARAHFRSFGPHPQFSEDFLVALDWHCTEHAGPRNWNRNSTAKEMCIAETLLAEMPELPASLELWRGYGIRTQAPTGKFDNFRDHKQIKFHNFLPTTTERDVAMKFVEQYNSFRHGVLLRMRTKPGAKGIVLEDFRKYYVPGEMLRGIGEGEVLLPPNTEWRVDDYNFMHAKNPGRCWKADLTQI